MLAPNPDLVEAKAFTEQEALQWLIANRLRTASDAELAELWGWNEAKVRRRRQAWEAQALTDVAPTGMSVSR
jgi:ferric-dicitrate binding protein FerR (iron transport regulator)